MDSIVYMVSFGVLVLDFEIDIVVMVFRRVDKVFYRVKGLGCNRIE